MALAQKRLSKDRQNFEGSLTASEIASLATDPDLRVLQTSSPVAPQTWTLLNENLFAIRHDVELRVFGFYSSVCDLSFLSQMENVRHFSADCLTKAQGTEYLCKLKNIISLSVGIYDLESFDVLRKLPAKQIQNLSLGATKSKRPTLEFLEDFKNLKTLYVEGQQKGIEAISSLTKLEDLTLRSVSTNGLDFLRGLDKLWSLDIKLGGIHNLSALEGLNQIKYIELWQVKGLSDISVISTMQGLEYIYLQALRNVSDIPNLSQLRRLRRIYLENMKGLNNFKSIASAPILEEFIHASALGLSPKDYEDILTMKSLKRAAVWFGSDRKNTAFRELASRYGIEEYKHKAFVFSDR